MNLLLAALFLLGLGALGSLLAGRRYRLVLTATLAASIPAALLILAAALPVLLGAHDSTLTTAWTVPGGAFLLRIDPLSGVFLLPVAILTPLAAIYGGSYLHHDAQQRSLGNHWALYSLLTASLLLVLTAANSLLFIAAWEGMTISSFFLVSYDHHEERVRSAAWLYLLVAHCGLLLILAFFLFAAQTCGSLNFADFTQLQQLPMKVATPLFLVALCGFGIKAGLFPFFVWLPDAHPAAPSHISAVMSGVVVNTGIYGVLRALSFLPSPPPLWGGILLTLGMLGALYGIAMALLQNDIKRSLAYSTVENIGIIFAGIGLGLLALSCSLPVVAVLSLAGALFHLWNHTLGKGLLFLGAGTLLHSTGSRDLDEMGGLLRRMPHAGLLLVGGAVTLAGLPPFNAFASEWLIYLGLLQGSTAFTGSSALAISLLFPLFGVIGALTVITYTRLVGIALLGEPRTPAAAEARDAERAMLWPMRLLFGGCLLLGLFPQVPLTLLRPLLAQLCALPAEKLTEILAPAATIGRWGAILLLLLAVGSGLFLYLRRSRTGRAEGTWGCGFQRPTAHMAYTAESYSEFAQSQLLPRALRPVIRLPRLKRLFPHHARFHQNSGEILLLRLYQPLFSFVADYCARLRWLQQGKQHFYLLYIFSCCALLMLWSILAKGGNG